MSTKPFNILESKLVKVLKVISPREMLQVGKFMHSPFFCPDKKAVQLFDLLKKGHPKFSEKTFNKHLIDSKLFSHKKSMVLLTKSELQKLRLTASYLLQRVYDYFWIKASGDYSLFQHWMLLLALDERDIKIDQKRLFEKYMGKLRQLSSPTAKDYLGMYLISDFELIHIESRLQERDIGTPLKYLDNFFLIEKLKHFCVALQLQIDASGVDYASLCEQFILNETFVYFEKNRNKSFLASSYYYLLKSLVAYIKEDYKGASVYYRHAKKLRRHLLTQISDDKDDISITFQDELINIYNISLSICNHLSRSLTSYYEYELFEMYQERLTYKLLYFNGFLHPHHFKNIITLALRLEKSDKAEELIHTYAKEVAPIYRKDVYAYNLAHVFLFKGKYSEVHKLLSQLRFIDPLYNVGSRAIRLKAYCMAFLSQKAEQAEIYEDFLRERYNFIRFLDRDDKLSNNQKESYQNFVSFLYRFMKIKAEGKGNLTKLIEDISACNNLFDRTWLNKIIA